MKTIETVFYVLYFGFMMWMAIRMNGYYKNIRSMHDDCDEMLKKLDETAKTNGVIVMSAIQRQAWRDHQQEQTNMAVAAYKAKLNSKKWWHKFFPRIVIIPRTL